MSSELDPAGRPVKRLTWLVPLVALVLALGAGFGLGYWRGRKSTVPSPPRSLVDWHEASFAVVPKEAVVMLTFDVGWLVDSLIEANAGLFPVKADPSSVREAIRGASRSLFGVDLLAAKRAVLWAIPDADAVAVLLEGDFEGTLVGKANADGSVSLNGGPTGQLTSAGLLLGTEAGVTMGAATIAGTRGSIAKDEATRADFTKALESVGEGQFIVTSNLGSLPLPGPLAGVRVVGASVRGDGGLAACAVGAEATLATALAQYQALKAAGKGAVDLALAHETTRAKEGSEGASWAALGLTLVKSKYDDIVELAKVEHRGELLTLTADGPGGLLAVYVATLANLAFRTLAQFQTTALVEAGQVELLQLDTHISRYTARNGSAPASLDALVDDELVRDRDLVDRWGTRYAYERRPDGTYRLCSAGPDRESGTADDQCCGGIGGSGVLVQ